ncbi:hypothetical protein IMZ08_02620 [Bacillus luteolus]|uniref:LAGLIDADG homing endonuclease n=1 Tax=Litchfieldia luteola TaxID=682179 RepID=A0ABR9QEN4_9BACI|nr:hypothetical protein [Cytobacillus luteolus]MBE4906950.1 hypothetical protein [Cytobacillus luteolus]MBP1943585.1 hypothetical protein [Cytobacillus luteolus]
MDHIEGYWNGVDGYYSPPKFTRKKGTIMKIFVEGDREIDPIKPETFGDFLKEWAYDTTNGCIRPYKILIYSHDRYSFTVQVEIIRKRKDIDELKHFYKGIHDYFNFYDIKIKKFETSLIS